MSDAGSVDGSDRVVAAVASGAETGVAATGMWTWWPCAESVRPMTRPVTWATATASVVSTTWVVAAAAVCATAAGEIGTACGTGAADGWPVEDAAGAVPAADALAAGAATTA
jgi:hypothetical protein